MLSELRIEDALLWTKDIVSRIVCVLCFLCTSSSVDRVPGCEPGGQRFKSSLVRFYH